MVKVHPDPSASSTYQPLSYGKDSLAYANEICAPRIVQGKNRDISREVLSIPTHTHAMAESAEVLGTEDSGWILKVILDTVVTVRIRTPRKMKDKVLP